MQMGKGDVFEIEGKLKHTNTLLGMTGDAI